MRVARVGLAALVVALAVPAAAEESSERAASAGAQELAKGLVGRPRIVQIAVPPFSEVGPGSAGWGKRTAELWAAGLAEASKAKVLGPARLASLLSESQIAALTGARAGEAAKVANAQALLVGEVMDQTDRLVVSVRLVSATTGNVFAASKQTFPLARAAPVAKAEPKQERTAEAKSGPAPAAAPAPAPVDPPRAAPRPAGGVESGRIDVVVRRLTDRLAEAFSKLPGSARYRRLAVLPLNEIGPQAKKHEIGAIVTAEIATNLRRDHGLLLVERAQLTQVMDELKLKELTGGEDASTVNNLGKLADAQGLIIGSVSDVGDEYIVNVRIVNAETGQAIAAESAKLPAAGMVALASDSVVLRSRSGAVFRSLIVPGWGQFYNRQGWKGVLFASAEIGLLGGALAFHLTGNWALGRYNENGPNTAGYWTLASERYSRRNILLYVAAGVWLVNVIDAYASGVDGNSALSGAMGQREPTFVPVVGTDGERAQVGALLRF